MKKYKIDRLIERGEKIKSYKICKIIKEWKGTFCFLTPSQDEYFNEWKEACLMYLKRQAGKYSEIVEKFLRIEGKKPYRYLSLRVLSNRDLSMAKQYFKRLVEEYLKLLRNFRRDILGSKGELVQNQIRKQRITQINNSQKREKSFLGIIFWYILVPFAITIIGGIVLYLLFG